MRQVLEAILLEKNTSGGAALRALLSSSGMYAGVAPQEVALTDGEYITLSALPGPIERTMEPKTNGSTFEEVGIDFNVWSNDRDPTAAWRVVEAVKELYDYNKFSVSGFSNLQAFRTDSGLPIEEPDQRGWHIVVPYIYTLCS